MILLLSFGFINFRAQRWTLLEESAYNKQMMMMVISQAIEFVIFNNVVCHLSFSDFISKIDFLLQMEMTVFL